MAAMDLQTKKLDLSARAIDLTMALMHATSSSSSLIKGAWEIGQWLGRERLNQYELLDCMSKAKGLVFPNRNGQKFFDEILEGIETMPVGPLFLQQSGSLGRLMAGDPNLSWMISTVACLFQHHRDDRVVSDILTAFILQAHRPVGSAQSLAAADSLIYNAEQTRLKAVVRKIVSSVWFNVVNVGCDTIPLPQELVSICEDGHYLDAHDFSVVTTTICNHCPGKAILRTNHLLRDVMLWLILHYDGTIIVTVAGEVKYKSSLGNPARELEVHVASACLETDDCSRVDSETYKILHDVGGTFQHFLSGYSFPSSEQIPRPGIRQKLYDIPWDYPPDSRIWNPTVQAGIKATAQSMMRWLLSRAVFPQDSFSRPGFTITPKVEALDGQLLVSSILARNPAIVNVSWSDGRDTEVGAFPSDAPPHQPAMDHDGRWLTRSFDIIHDLVDNIMSFCACEDCRVCLRSGMLRGTDGKPGCLVTNTMGEVFLLLAHGIADGFGVDSASSISEEDAFSKNGGLQTGIRRLLYEMVVEEKIYWDTWFGVAACVFLGCPFVLPPDPTHPAFGGTSFAAIQYGNLAVTAPWLDLSREIPVVGCFELIKCRGRLGIAMKHGEPNTNPEFRGVEELFAVIETENTEDNSTFCSRNKKAAVDIDHGLALQNDKNGADTDVILFPVDDKFYRLCLRVRTDTHWRIVDPSDALSATIRMLPPSRCQHGSTVPELAPTSAKIYTMDEVVGRWPDTIQSYVSTSQAGQLSPPDGVIHLTNVLDTHLKKNIALALSVCTTAVPNYVEQSCITCAVLSAKNSQRKPLRDGEGGNVADRYIINLKSDLMERGGPGSRLLLQGGSGDGAN